MDRGIEWCENQMLTTFADTGLRINASSLLCTASSSPP